MTDVRGTAQRAYALNICVLPAAADGSKRPGVPSWAEYQKARPDKAAMRRLFPAEGGPDGIGFVTGAISGGLELFEFDDAEVEQEFRALAADAGAGDLIEKLDACYSERTPSGGLHWLYRCATIEGNTKLASEPLCACGVAERAHGEAHPFEAHPHKTKTVIETRGEGGWVVVAPSHGTTHPSGEPYTIIRGGVATIPIIDASERERLHALARSMNRVTHVRMAERLAAISGGGDRPGDRFNAAASWESILEPAGWRLLYRHGGEGYWAHPEAPTGRGAKPDATTDARGHPYLYVFSTSAAPFEADRGYDRMGTYAALYHNGDVAEAAKAIAAMPEYADPEDTYDGGDLGKVVPVPPPVFVDKKPPRAEGFTHAFPPDHFVTRWVKWGLSQTDAAAEYHEAVALVLLACATPGVRAYLPFWPDGLPTNLYVMLLGQSSTSRKSTAMGFGKRAQRSVQHRTILPDRMSPEAWIEQMSQRTDTSTLWVHDEIGKFLAELGGKGRAQNASMGANLLSAYDAQPIRYARHSKRVKGGDTIEDEDVIDKSHMSILGAATPSIYGVSGITEMTEDGLLPRFAIVMGRSRPPRRDWGEIRDADAKEYTALVYHLSLLGRWTENGTEPPTAKITPSAMAALNAFDMALEARVDEYPILGRLPAMALKVAMLAAAGRMAEEPSGDRLEVHGSDVEAAKVVCLRWADNAVEFVTKIGSGQHSEAEQRIGAAVAFLREHGGSVSRRDVARRFHLSKRDCDDLRDTLVDRGLISEASARHGTARPIVVWKAIGAS